MDKRRQLVSQRAVKITAALLLLALAPLALALFEESDPISLRLGTPVVSQRTNLSFQAQNPTPECACNLQFATNLSSPIGWTTFVQGSANQTNFYASVPSTIPRFFRLRYKPYIAGPSMLYAAQNTSLAITNVQVLSFQGTGHLSLSASLGPLRLGTTNGLTFTAGANGQSSFTVSGDYSAMSAALSTLSYVGHGALGATDTLSIVLANIGSNGRCVDSNSVRILLDSPPFAYEASYSGVGQVEVPAPGLLGCCAYDPEGNPMFVVAQSTVTANGQLELRADGSLSYHPFVQPTASLIEQFQFRVYDTFGGSLHATSTAQGLTIMIDPPSGAPKTSP